MVVFFRRNTILMLRYMVKCKYISKGSDVMNQNIRIMVAIQKLNMSLQKTAIADLQQYGLLDKEFAILSHLNAKGKCKTQELGDVAFITSGAITYFINKMIKKELVVKLQDKEDKRIFWIDLSNKGKEKFDYIMERHMPYIDNLFSDFNESEKNKFVELIKYFGKTIEGIRKEDIMKLRDFKGLFKSEVVEFVSAENVSADYYVVKLKLGENTSWRPGEHGIFTLPNSKVTGKKWRAFSVASTMEENVILLGTRTGDSISSFKNELINLKPGDKVKMRGPFGWFVEQDKTSPMVLIAGGVGITPLRALLTSLKDAKKDIHLIYSSQVYFLFKEELDVLIKGNKAFSVSFVETVEETSKEIVKTTKKYNNKAFYYISGSQGMIKGVTNTIRNNGVKKSRIINDPFIGY